MKRPWAAARRLLIAVLLLASGTVTFGQGISISIYSGTNPIACNGGTTLIANVSAGSGVISSSTITWYREGTAIGNGYSYTATQPGYYTATVTMTVGFPYWNSCCSTYQCGFSYCCSGCNIYQYSTHTYGTYGITLSKVPPTVWYRDADGDGAGDPAVTLTTCSQPLGYVGNSNDGCPTDPAKTTPGVCGCGVADVAQTYYADVDGDGFGAGAPIPGHTCAPPSGTVTNNLDDCPDLLGRIGDACDDGDPTTTDDVITANCACAGTPPPPCTMDLVFETVMQDDGDLPTWEVRDAATHELVLSGGGGPGYGGSPIAEPFCLPDGDYYFVVDHVPAGATYTVHGAAAPYARVLDNTAPVGTAHHVATTGTSGGTIQLPMSGSRLLDLACDKYWWKAGDYLVANEEPAVAALWNNGNAAQQANTGYDFWFYDPNGGYSYVRERRHNQADGYGNVGSTRTCHMRVNSALHSWSAADHIPENRPLNVRVRAVVNGVAGPWGPACRFTRNEAMAACPPTTLWRVPVSDPKYSCDNTQRNWSTHTNQRIYAHPVSGATQYRFRFTNLNEGFDVTRTTSTYYLNMGWGVASGAPLQAGRQYQVTVQANKGGGLGPNDDGWCTAGAPCTILICGPQGQGCGSNVGPGDQQSLLEPLVAPQVRLWPNPTNGELLHVNITGLPEDAVTVTMDIHDLGGKQALSRTLVLPNGHTDTTVDLGGALPPGCYITTITAAGQRYQERLVVLRP